MQLCTKKRGKAANAHKATISGAHVNIDIREQENSEIRYIGRYDVYVTSAGWGFQISVTTTCSGGKISYIFTNCIPNISALISIHITY